LKSISEVCPCCERRYIGEHLGVSL
jgi:hypothetical protein